MAKFLTAEKEIILRGWLDSGHALRTREAAQVSRMAVAREIGVNESALYRWEHGQRFPRGLLGAEYYKVLLRLGAEGATQLVQVPVAVKSGEPYTSPQFQRYLQAQAQEAVLRYRGDGGEAGALVPA